MLDLLIIDIFSGRGSLLFVYMAPMTRIFFRLTFLNSDYQGSVNYVHPKKSFILIIVN